MSSNNILQRFVSDFGETLIVRFVAGVKTLTDPCDASLTVVVPTGRRARLVRYAICGLARPLGRDILTQTFKNDLGTGFISIGRPNLSILLRDLPEGQIVDILPATDVAAVYAVLPRTVPELHGAVAVQPVYAELAA